MRPIIIGFGIMILCLLILFKIAEVNFVQGNVRLEVIVAIAAMVFFFVGLYFNHRNNNRPTVQETAPANSQPPPTAIDYEQLKKSGLTQREHDVLVKMAEGLSNGEIAAQLFLSESTVKTHVSNILFKLEAKRRTQAIQLAKQQRLVI